MDRVLPPAEVDADGAVGQSDERESGEAAGENPRHLQGHIDRARRAAPGESEHDEARDRQQQQDDDRLDARITEPIRRARTG